MALRIAGNYMLKDEKVSLSEQGEDIFNPHEDDIKDYFDDEDYLIIHGSFIFGPEKEQPGDIDLIIPMLDSFKADKEVDYELVIGDLENMSPADFANAYRVSNLHPSKYGSAMDAYLGIPLWGNIAIGSIVYEEWKKIWSDFKKLSEKVLDKGRDDSKEDDPIKVQQIAFL